MAATVQKIQESEKYQASKDQVLVLDPAAAHPQECGIRTGAGTGHLCAVARSDSGAGVEARGEAGSMGRYRLSDVQPAAATSGLGNGVAGVATNPEHSGLYSLANQRGMVRMGQILMSGTVGSHRTRLNSTSAMTKYRTEVRPSSGNACAYCGFTIYCGAKGAGLPTGDKDP